MCMYVGGVRGAKRARCYRTPLGQHLNNSSPADT